MLTHSLSQPLAHSLTHFKGPRTLTTPDLSILAPEKGEFRPDIPPAGLPGMLVGREDECRWVKALFESVVWFAFVQLQ